MYSFGTKVGEVVEVHDQNAQVHLRLRGNWVNLSRATARPFGYYVSRREWGTRISFSSSSWMLYMLFVSVRHLKTVPSVTGVFQATSKSNIVIIVGHKILTYVSGELQNQNIKIKKVLMSRAIQTKHTQCIPIRIQRFPKREHTKIKPQLFELRDRIVACVRYPRVVDCIQQSWGAP